MRQHASVAAQVAAANDVEALARRLVATAAASPRVQGQRRRVAGHCAQFLERLARTDAAAGFNQDVASYEHERRGPVRAVVASVLGDGSIPVLDTTATDATTVRRTDVPA